MDSLTQIAIGITTAQLYAGKELHQKAYLYGAILGTLPDLDVVVGRFMDPVQGVAIHRGLSHSLLFFVFMAPLLGWLITKLERGKINYRRACFLAFLCLVTHVAIDLFTSWGTQVFWPLPYRIAFKTIFVIDPLYTLPLLIALIMAWNMRSPGLRKKCMLRGLYISSVYLALTCAIKLYAVQQFKNALVKEGIVYEDLIVKPTAFNCILWNCNVATKEFYLLADYSLLDTKPITFTKYTRNNALARQLSGNTDFETLKKISEGWFIVTSHNGHYYFNDLRFGLLANDSKKVQFAFSYIFVQENGKMTAKEVSKQKRDGIALLKRIAHRIISK